MTLTAQVVQLLGTQLPQVRHQVVDLGALGRHGGALVEGDLVDSEVAGDELGRVLEFTERLEGGHQHGRRLDVRVAAEGGRAPGCEAGRE